jgi:outer membrane protein assembly factor BamB
MSRTRRDRLALGVLLLASAALAAPAEPPARNAWPVSRRSAEQRGVASSTLPDKLEVLWTFKTDDAIEGAVAVKGGVVYAGSMDENLYAVDLASGKRRWKYKGGPFRAGPAVRGGSVYAGDLDGVLHCVDAAKGTKVWAFEAGAEVGGINFHDRSILFTSHDEHLYCLSAAGKQLWKFKVDGQIYGSPAVAEGKTFLVGCDSKLHVLDVARGKELRAVDLGGQTGASAAVRADRLYVGTMRDEFLAIDWKKGSLAWTYTPEKRSPGFFSSPAVTDSLVVVGCRDNLVHAIDRKTGKESWTFPTRNKVDSSPVVAGGRVVVGSLDGNLYVLDLASGKLLQRLALDGPVNASPVVVAGKVLIGTQKGTLYCLGARK